MKTILAVASLWHARRRAAGYQDMAGLITGQARQFSKLPGGHPGPRDCWRGGHLPAPAARPIPHAQLARRLFEGNTAVEMSARNWAGISCQSRSSGKPWWWAMRRPVTAGSMLTPDDDAGARSRQYGLGVGDSVQ